MSEATGWGIVPPTVLRDGPAGAGMVQLWLDEDRRSTGAWARRGADPRLRPMALLDAVAQQHGSQGRPHRAGPRRAAVRLYGVDHGVCFSTDPKLRTVLWAWRDEPIEPTELDVLGRLRAALDDALGDALGELLDPAEVAATGARLDALLDAGALPDAVARLAGRAVAAVLTPAPRVRTDRRGWYGGGLFPLPHPWERGATPGSGKCRSGSRLIRQRGFGGASSTARRVSATSSRSSARST